MVNMEMLILIAVINIMPSLLELQGPAFSIVGAQSIEHVSWQPIETHFQV